MAHYRYIPQIVYDNTQLGQVNHNLKNIFLNIYLSLTEKYAMQSEARRPTSHTLDSTQNNSCRLSLYCGTELNSKSNSLNSIPSHSLVLDGGSLQFPSDLGLDDGLSVSSVNTDKKPLENVPKLLKECAISRTLDSVTNIPLLRPQNTSSDSVSKEARHKFEGTFLNQEAIAVSQDEFKQMAEELEKTKRYLHNLLKDGSFTSMYIDVSINAQCLYLQVFIGDFIIYIKTKNDTCLFI